MYYIRLFINGSGVLEIIARLCQKNDTLLRGVVKKMIAMDPNSDHGLLGTHDGTLAGQCQFQRKADPHIQHGLLGNHFIRTKQDPCSADVHRFAVLPIGHAAFTIIKGNMDRKTLGTVYVNLRIRCHCFLCGIELWQTMPLVAH